MQPRVSLRRMRTNLLTALLVLAVVAGGVVTWRLMMPPPVNEHTRIVVIFKSTDPSIVFWRIVKAGVETAAKELDVSVRVMGPMEEKDIAGQIKMVDGVVREHPAAIVLAADDYNALVPAARKIRSAGIRLVTIDSGLNGNISSSFIATDNREAGRKAGDLVASLLRYKGNIAIVSYVKGTLTSIERERGVRDVVDTHPDLRIVGTYYCDDLADRAYAITARLLRERPRPDAIVALNEVSTVGAAKAVAALHMKAGVDLVGFDNSPVEIRYLQAGVIRGIVLQKPFNIGYLGVATAVKLLKGVHVQRRIDTGSLLVTKQNMQDRESQKLLFPLIDGE